jgi:hypothetical protein
LQTTALYIFVGRQNFFYVAEPTSGPEPDPPLLKAALPLTGLGSQVGSTAQGVGKGCRHARSAAWGWKEIDLLLRGWGRGSPCRICRSGVGKGHRHTRFAVRRWRRGARSAGATWWWGRGTVIPDSLFGDGEGSLDLPEPLGGGEGALDLLGG